MTQGGVVRDPFPLVEQRVGALGGRGDPVVLVGVGWTVRIEQRQEVEVNPARCWVQGPTARGW